MGALDELLELQALDLAVDQATRRLSQLPERDALAAARRDRDEARAAVARCDRELESAEAGLAASEGAAAEIDAKVESLKARLRNVIAIREVEALQSEIAALMRRRGEHDDEGLLALERAEGVGSERDAWRSRLPGLDAAVDTAADALAVAETDVRAQIDALTERRPDLVGRIPEGLMARYVSLRSTHGGVVVARLNGSRCEACHLDLSRAEVEALRSAPDDQPADCPSCSRLLVR